MGLAYRTAAYPADSPYPKFKEDAGWATKDQRVDTDLSGSPVLHSLFPSTGIDRRRRNHQACLGSPRTRGRTRRCRERIRHGAIGRSSIR